MDDPVYISLFLFVDTVPRNQLGSANLLRASYLQAKLKQPEIATDKTSASVAPAGLAPTLASFNSVDAQAKRIFVF